jgi:hypothetical protein
MAAKRLKRALSCCLRKQFSLLRSMHYEILHHPPGCRLRLILRTHRMHLPAQPGRAEDLRDDKKILRSDFQLLLRFIHGLLPEEKGLPEQLPIAIPERTPAEIC